MAVSFDVLRVDRPRVDWRKPEKAPPVNWFPPRRAPRPETWFSLRAVDEVGAGVNGVDVTFSHDGDTLSVSTDGAGVARLDGVQGSGTVGAKLADVADVRDHLKPRWKNPRDPRIPGGPNTVVRELAGALDPLSIPKETPTTLVLTPYFRCNEIPGTHFEFGRSFVRSDALEPLARIAEALSADDGRKALIFGHTDLSGSEALNKELSERRAKALYALFVHDADAWEELYSGSADGSNWHEKWDLEEAQHMLNALGVTDDDGNPLKEDGVRGERTKQAIHRFQSGNYPDCPAEQARLEQSDVLGKDGRKELFLAYAKRVSRQPADRRAVPS